MSGAGDGACHPRPRHLPHEKSSELKTGELYSGRAPAGDEDGASLSARSLTKAPDEGGPSRSGRAHSWQGAAAPSRSPGRGDVRRAGLRPRSAKSNALSHQSPRVQRGGHVAARRRRGSDLRVGDRVRAPGRITPRTPSHLRPAKPLHADPERRQLRCGRLHHARRDRDARGPPGGPPAGRNGGGHRFGSHRAADASVAPRFRMPRDRRRRGRGDGRAGSARRRSRTAPLPRCRAPCRRFHRRHRPDAILIAASDVERSHRARLVPRPDRSRPRRGAPARSARSPFYERSSKSALRSYARPLRPEYERRTRYPVRLSLAEGRNMAAVLDYRVARWTPRR